VSTSFLEGRTAFAVFHVKRMTTGRSPVWDCHNARVRGPSQPIMLGRLVAAASTMATTGRAERKSAWLRAALSRRGRKPCGGHRAVMLATLWALVGISAEGSWCVGDEAVHRAMVDAHSRASCRVARRRAAPLCPPPGHLDRRDARGGKSRGGVQASRPQVHGHRPHLDAESRPRAHRRVNSTHPGTFSAFHVKRPAS
jgi:hypothetical protein